MSLVRGALSKDGHARERSAFENMGPCLRPAGPTENQETLADCMMCPRNLLLITVLSDRCGQDCLLTETLRTPSGTSFGGRNLMQQA